ncbi:MAG: hypothetical protein ABI277_06265 [Burkholderiaceae bacterium]
MTRIRLTRRAVLGAALPWLAACTTPLPLGPRPASDKTAAMRLQESAEAHGLASYRGITDISVSYDGRWRPFVNRIQPDVVDAGYRGGSQERLLPQQGVVAQAYAGPSGHKQVAWHRGGGESAARPGSISVWRNGVRSSDPATLEAAALVAEGYGLFLLGPLWVVDRGLAVRSGGTETVDGRLCDVVDVWLQPGLGEIAMDRVAICIDRADDVARRIRFTLEGSTNTRGAVAEVDTYDHERRFGLLWPMRSYERVVHPIRIPAHDWHITGLDVNRGFDVDDVSGPQFTGRAAAAAAAL